MPADLVEFLRECLNEDEQAARAVGGGTHWVSNSETVYELDTNDPVVVGPWSSDLGSVGDHIARYDPAWALAEVVTKRAIVDLHGRPHRCPNHLMHDTEPCGTLKWLAQPYTSHPDFDPAWSARTQEAL